MSFLHPEFIYLMLPVLLLLFGLLLTQSDPQEHFFSPETLAKLRVDSKRLSAKARNVFYFLMFFFIILALAGPVVEKGHADVKAKDDLFYVALDISDSMLCEDVYPNRLDSGKQKVLQLLQKEAPYRIGLIAFAESSYLVAPPTFDHKMLAFLLKPMDSGYTSEHGTNILNLLKSAAKQLKGREEKRLLLVSDGGDKPVFTEEIAYAKKEGIRIYLLAIGTENGAVVPRRDGSLRQGGETVISRVNRAAEMLAKESGGAVLQTDDFSPLLASMAASLTGQTQKAIYFHIFVLPIGLAMFMLLLATSSFHKGEKYHLPLLFLALFGSQPQSAEGALFDDKDLERAKEAYRQEDYRKSAKAYARYALENESTEAAYNAANSYYRSGRYKMALGLYETIAFADRRKNHQLYHNMGNAFAKIGDIEDLKKAVLAYEKALTFQEDPQSRENMENVKKALHEREEAIKRNVLQQTGAENPSISSASRGNKGGAKSAKNKSLGSSVMSDREADKWLKTLQQRQHPEAYRIDVPEPDEGADSAKPW